MLGFANIVYGLFGAGESLWLIQIHWHDWPGSPSAFQWAVFFLLSAFTCFLVIWLSYLGIRLIGKKESALLALRNVFIVEILYFIATNILFWNMLPISMATIAIGFWGIADGPLMPQYVTGYPVIGVIATIVLLKTSKSRKQDLSEADAKQFG